MSRTLPTGFQVVWQDQGTRDCTGCMFHNPDANLGERTCMKRQGMMPMCSTGIFKLEHITKGIVDAETKTNGGSTVQTKPTFETAGVMLTL